MLKMTAKVVEDTPWLFRKD